MSGELNLRALLANMSPELLDGEFVFCCFADSTYGDRAELQPIAAFQESEGLTLVIPKARADKHGVTYDGVFRCITLRVHSSLEAVGLTAAFAAELTRHDISANVVAGYYHDHIFVQSAVADKAVAALRGLTQQT